MKKNNKGFTLIETLIVSTFVAATLTYLFIQINNTLTNYDITYRYDSINAIYNANTITSYLKQNGYQNLITLSASSGYVDITTSTNVNGKSTYYNLLIDKMSCIIRSAIAAVKQKEMANSTKVNPFLFILLTS